MGGMKGGEERRRGGEDKRREERRGEERRGEERGKIYAHVCTHAYMGVRARAQVHMCVYVCALARTCVM